ncbi:ParA family protein [Lactococcus sp. dk322]|uniref:ParA family protein n=1 Tax=Lactococcus sp. dk322 TaxID=2603290 RepID=UPI0011CADAEB|nr:ParA family protein [Lactococcus sp. dk322]TXK46355.1 ParA family protein [Lactococcus sp. dk322]
MKVISFMAIKGGGGKTTIAFQFAQYLQSKNKKVLMIDMDSQKSLTGTFVNKENNFLGKYNISDILLKNYSDDFSTKVSENIDVIPSISNLEEVADNLSNKPNKELLLFMWFIKYSRILDERYDFVLIDLPPAWNLLTKNGAAVADIIISPLEPSRFGYESYSKVLQSVNVLKNELVDPLNGQTYISAKVFFIGNRVKHNTKSSREFLEAIENLDNVIGVIPEKELINTSMLVKMSVYDYAIEINQNQSQVLFLNNISEIFKKIEKLEE